MTRNMTRKNKNRLTKRFLSIGMTGFEPAAYCSRSNRATKLRYIPIPIEGSTYLTLYSLIPSTVIVNMETRKNFPAWPGS